jgi:hypothetical protein
MDEILNSLHPGELRVFLGISQFCSFLLPGLVGLYLIPLHSSSYRHQAPWWIYPFFVACYIISLPIFQWLFYINLNLTVPEWWPFQVQAIPPFLIELLSDMSILDLLSNIFVIALLPALGEELIFRVLGIRLGERIFKSRHLAVVITALSFALVHFDFQGILPRFFLGIVLGYSFLLSRSWWVPFLIHFIHNGSQLFIAYFTPSSLEGLNQNIESPNPIWISLSLVLLLGAYYFMRKKERP